MEEKQEPLILAIETSTRAGSVSLVRGQHVLSAALGDGSSSHSSDLIDNIERVLRDGNAGLIDVDLLAVSVGPGSFTGLRIGLATVKAFAACAHKPCAAVSTLAAIAHGAGDSNRTVATLPAGRGEVYAQLFSVRGDVVQPIDEAAHLKPTEVVERYRTTGNLLLAGEAAHQCIQSATRSGGSDGGWSLAPQPEYLANSVAALALSDYRKGEVLSGAALRANYVRASDAEINERWLQRK
jgi:tRNA threonylcarbamoyladenosine biosynthesis protein TsaB